MVNDSWFSSLWTSSRKNGLEQSEKLMIGVLALEVSNFMSKVIHLWECLSDRQFGRLRAEIMSSEGVKKLVSEDEDFLLGLMCGEVMENLEYLARFVGRLGKRCRNTVLQRFEHVFDDLVYTNADLYGWEYAWKKMERKVKKMGRFIAVNASLNQELEVLSELEQALRRVQKGGDPSRNGLLDCQEKVVWQRQEVKHLRENSLSNRTYDYIVHLLARSLFTIFGRIRHVFGVHLMEAVLGVKDSRTMDANYLTRSQSVSTPMQSSVHPCANNLIIPSSGPLGMSFTKSSSVSSTNRKGAFDTKPVLGSGSKKTRNKQCQIQNQSSTLPPKHPHHKVKRLVPIGPFKGCMVSGSDSPVLHSFTPVRSDHLRSNVVDSGVINGVENCNVDSKSCSKTLQANLPLSSSKRKVLKAPPFTLGAAALAPHYANVIIIIEKLVASPHLIGPEARDDLYNMLPTSLRVALRARLKSYAKKLSSCVYNTDLAAEWSEALTRILEWLVPLARNMVRWQSERSFEQQHSVSRTSVLLVQTLYFADQGKVEAAITELLVGLNYLWRVGRDLDSKALQECAISRNFDGLCQKRKQNCQLV